MIVSLALALAFGVSSTVRSGAQALVEHFAEGGGGPRLSEKVRAIVERHQAEASADEPDADPDTDTDTDTDSDLEVVPPRPPT
jgi:hypothetical protein